MAGKKGAGENSKKAQGQARKAEQAANKAAAEGAKKAVSDEADWDRGAKKGNAKKEAAEEKKAEAARKKAEREALLAEEEKSIPSSSAPKNAKSAEKKTKGLDLSQLDDEPLSELNATGILNAIDALGLVDNKSAPKVDRHPERRGWTYGPWKKRRLEDMENNDPEWDQIKKYRPALDDRLWKEWQKSPENPKNQLHAQFNSNQEDMSEIRAHLNKSTEKRLATK